MSLLVVDLGTSAVQCTLWSPSCKQIASSNIYSHVLPLSPLTIFQTVESAMDDLLAKTKTHEIHSVGFATFGMSLVGIEPDHSYSYFATYQGDDQATTPSPPKEMSCPIIKGIPNPLHPSYALIHVLSSRSFRFSTLISALLERWFNHTFICPISYSEASWWGMFDYETLQWSPCFSDHRIRLPPVCEFNSFANRGHQTRFPQLRNATFLLGIVDGAAQTLGAAPVGEVVISIATSAAARCVMSRHSLPNPPPQGCFVHVLDANLVVLGGSTVDGGSIRNLFSQPEWFPSVRGKSELELLQRVCKVRMVCLPFFSPTGERALGWKGRDIPGAFVGVETDTTLPEDFLLSAMLGVGSRLGDVVKALITSRSTSLQYAFVSGSALVHSQVWKCVVSGSLGGITLVQAQQGDGERDNTTARGVAMLVFHHRVSGFSTVFTPVFSHEEHHHFVEYNRKQKLVYAGLLNSLL